MANLGWHPVQPALAMHYWSSTLWRLCPRVFDPRFVCPTGGPDAGSAPGHDSLLLLYRSMMLCFCFVAANTEQVWLRPFLGRPMSTVLWQCLCIP